ncbi:MAG: geranylgeranylglycerol-phosphate geranylgeranyltransferase [Bacteroidetes bacterium]|nr:geranylgeranylglycerol-phosphate geranylgeranyltransferase [Bacteroidota bacterium]
MVKNLKYYLLLVRPANLGIIALTQLLFMLAATRFNFLYFRLPECITVIFAVVFTAAAGNVINDIFDIEEDQINKPEKRIIQKHISTKNGRIFYGILVLLAIIAGFYTGWGMGFLCMAISVMLYFYSSDLKGTNLQGNLLISFLTAAVVYTAARGVMTVADGYFAEFSILAFCITMAREIIKDCEDLEGDKAQEYETFPIVYGMRKAIWLAAAFLIVTDVLLIFLMARSGKIVFITYSTAAILLPAAYILFRMFSAAEKKDYHSISTWLKILMITGLCAVLFL